MILAAIWRTTTIGVRVDVINSIQTLFEAAERATTRNQAWLMTFANPSTAVQAARIVTLRQNLRAFDVVAPDGIGMVLAMRWLHRRPAVRVSFDTTSLAPHVFRMANQQRLRIVLIGGMPGVADEAKAQLAKLYPYMRIIGVLEGYHKIDAAAETVHRLNPDIVVVGMGVCVQEEFLLKLADAGWVGLGFTCGGYLDQLSLKGEHYYPAWVDRANLRWAYRLIMEPRRLWRRYLLDYPEFGLRLFSDLTRAAGAALGQRIIVVLGVLTAKEPMDLNL